MAAEHASMLAVHKPWGSTNLLPWSDIRYDGGAIGELWCQREKTRPVEPALLLKLLFTTAPLSIQVHPDDAYARSIGLEHGKTEAWYILAAAENAQVAVGLKTRLDATQLRAAVANGSIADLLQWHAVQKDDVIFVPAGTIHAVGAGIVLAEIQQRSDATFRLFDYGRRRELQLDDAVAAARLSPQAKQAKVEKLTDARTLLTANPYFVLERLDLAPDSRWEFNAERETWLLVLAGHARIGSMKASIGKAFFMEDDSVLIKAESDGLTCLVAYPGPAHLPELLGELHQSASEPSARGFLPSPLPAHRRATASVLGTRS